MRLSTPKTAAPGGGLEPAVRYDFLSPDELAGQGVQLYPAATPPVVDHGMTLNGVNQYARARNSIVLPQSFTWYAEFNPAFAYDEDAAHALSDGDSGASRVMLLKNDAAGLYRLLLLVGTGAVYAASADYSALWRRNQRNRICVMAASGGGSMYLNGSAVAVATSPWTLTHSSFFYVGASFTASSFFSGVLYDMQIYPRLVTAAEAIQMTTGSP
jgi:hypothetical protein